MKTLRIIVASSMLLSVSSIAMTSKVKDDNKTVYSVLEGTTVDQVAKPGLAIDLSYKSQHVEVGETSNVNVVLTTGLSKGTLKVNIKALDDSLLNEEKNLEFDLSKGEKSFPIALQVSSAEDGIHYLNFTLSVEGEGSRVVAVPVNVGTISTKVDNKVVTTTDKGVTVSVAAAEEEIQ